MFQKYYTLLLLCFYYLSSFSSYGYESNTYTFRTFSPEGGFYYDGIAAIQQDKEGFIWILMDNDLYRFDGYQYKRYYSHFKDKSVYEDIQFKTIACDSLGQLFVGTTNGLFKYNKIANTFSKLLNSNISLLKVDTKNNLWVKQGNTFGRYNENGETFDTAHYQNENIKNINSFDSDKSGFFISTFFNKIYRFDDESKQYSLFYTFPNNYRIQSIKKSHNKLWVLVADEGLFKIDIPSISVEEKFDFFHQTDGQKIMTKTLHIDKFGQIWIATQKGLYILNPTTKEYQHHLHSKTNPFSLPNNSVWTISEDHQQNIWLGTYSGGLSYVNLEEKARFKTYLPKDSQLNHNLISGFAEDENYIWVATEGDGLNRINKQTNTFAYYTNNPKVSNSLSSDNVKSIVLDPSNNLWISTFRGGLNCYNTKTNEFKHFKKEENTINSLKSNDLRKIILEGDSGLWIAYQQNKLQVSFYSFKDEKFTHIDFGGNNNNQFIFDICRGKNNELWLISHKQLYKMNTQSGKVEDIALADSLHLGAQTICTDGYDNVWIGTIGHGLIMYNTKTNTFTPFNEVLNFNVSSIYSICSDDENNLWLGTDNGLFKYNVSANTYLRFDKIDGIQGQVFYPLSTFKSKTGELFFGGTNGFTIVNPSDLIKNTFKPKAIITDFFIDNIPITEDSQKYSSQKTFAFPNVITLDYDQSNFGFEFSSNNYLLPQKNRYKYRLKGYDNRWIEVDASNRKVLYSKVPSGNYTLEIYVSNNDGEWGDTPTTIRIRKLPAPWLTWYAYLFYAIAIIAIIYVIIWYYNQQKRLKVQVYLDKLDKDKKEEIHQSQLRFFTNISHDFKTPLSVIIASLDRLRQDGLKEYYYKILHGNSQRLLNLVNELMDFRTLENGKMPLQIEFIDVNSIVNKIVVDFEDYAKQKDISLSVHNSPQLSSSLPIDPNILEKIIINLVDNALKYTNQGGNISISTYKKGNVFQSQYENSFTVKSDTELKEYFSIVVKDTGIGISKESIANVFERFYKVKMVDFDSHLGTGIGLALVKSLVLLHKGEVTIFSKRKKGTDIEVRLPYNPDVYEENQFRQNNKETSSISFSEETDDLSDIVNTETIMRRERKRILLVEDNDDLRSLIADSLAQEYEVVEAPNGQIAFSLIEKLEVNLIISDIMMPVKDGITLCREVKANLNYSHIPVIQLTAKTGLDSKLEGADSGADLYFEKPIDFTLLKLSIKNIFEHQKQLKEYYAKNYYVDSIELSTNEQDNKFLKNFMEILDDNIDQANLDVNYIASELSMSRSKLYTKIKNLTDKSIVEFILSHRLRKAAHLIVEEDLSMREVMDKIGIESQSYFSRAFKKEFGDTPTAFASKNKKKDK